MSFHVEVSRGLQHARAFNLDRERLRSEVLEPWTQGRRFELGDQQWTPSKSSLRILEGPNLDQTNLNFGRGWDSAERTARDVTVSVLQRVVPPVALRDVAVLAETPWGRQRVSELLERLGVRAVDWPEARGAALKAALDPDSPDSPMITILAAERAEPVGWWLFEAGLALGALGRRAIVAQLGNVLPEPMRQLAIVRLDDEEVDSLPALAERLQLAGLPLGTPQGGMPQGETRS